ncbi:MAG: transglutaminase domain-containing protein, partial [Clostridia bacterium]|nr:transglutaminase domain-containing protein [Clostridia bacterium]
MKTICYESQLCPLPEDIERLKSAGEYDEALRLIGERLKRPLPDLLKQRLETEQWLLPQWAAEYPLSHDQLLREFEEKVEGFTARELDGLLLDGKLDFLYINGERRYYRRLCDSVIKTTPALQARAKAGATAFGRKALDAVIARMMDHGVVFRYRLQTRAFLDPPGEGALCRVHLPIAARSMQQEAAQDLACTVPLAHVDDEDAPQRTAYFETTAREAALEYTVIQRPVYVNALDETVRRVVYPNARPVCPEDLMEQPPHLAFTPYLRSLAAQVRGRESDPVRIAWQCYLYITTQVHYAFMPPYRLLPSGAEYAAVNLRGDCGLQALLFIALCRLNGIPARWQSGLAAEPGSIGSHDWAEFYSERLGWLPVDCSYGGTAARAKNETRHRFY